MKRMLALIAPFVIVAATYAGEGKDVTIPELKAAIAAKKVILLDANGTQSWQQGHIANAIDFKGNKEKLATVLPADKGALIVAYCGGPRCQAYKAAVAAAEKLGYTNIKHLPAGIHGWKDAGEPTQKGS